MSLKVRRGFMGLLSFARDFDDLAEAIADPNPNRPIENQVGNTGRLICDSLANTPEWALNLLATAPGGQLLAPIKRVCDPYYAGQGFDPPSLETPFSGGQCDAVYVVRIAATRNDSNPPNEVSCRVRGPIEGVRILNSPPTGVVQIRAFNTLSSSSSCGTLNSISLAWRNAGLGGAVYLNGSASIVSITPCGDDDCGDPPPQLSPGENRPSDPGPLPPGVTPVIGPSGQPEFRVPDIPGGDGFPDVPVPDDPFNPTPPPALGPDGGGFPGDPDSTEPTGTATPEGGGEVEFGDPPEGRAWVGAFVRLNVPSFYGSIPKNAGNNFAFPRVIGNAFLTYAGGRSEEAKRLVSEEVLLTRPHPTLEVTGAVVNCLPEITATVFPISAIICPEGSCTNTPDN